MTARTALAFWLGLSCLSAPGNAQDLTWSQIHSGAVSLSGDVQAWMIRCDYDGDPLWTWIYGDSLYDMVRGLAVDDSGFVYGSGLANSAGNSFFGWNFKLLPASSAVPGGDPAVVHGFNLSIFPNPFNPVTALCFELREASHVSLRVYDTAGREVATLVDGWKEAGSHKVTFHGMGLAGGIYFARLEAGEYRLARKMVVLK